MSTTQSKDQEKEEGRKVERQPIFLNFYKCPACGYEWQDEWEAQPDDDCPNCRKRHISPYESGDLCLTADPTTTPAEGMDMANPDLNAILAAANEAYEEGCCRVDELLPVGARGDGLADFIASELREVCGYGGPPNVSIYRRAVAAMERAEYQLSCVLNELEALEFQTRTNAPKRCLPPATVPQ
jgi:hypothetical protein